MSFSATSTLASERSYVRTSCGRAAPPGKLMSVGLSLVCSSKFFAAVALFVMGLSLLFLAELTQGCDRGPSEGRRTSATTKPVV